MSDNSEPPRRRLYDQAGQSGAVHRRREIAPPLAAGRTGAAAGSGEVK